VDAANRPSAIIAADLIVPVEVLSQVASEAKIPFVLFVRGDPARPSEWMCRLGPTTAQVATGVRGYLVSAGLKSGEAVNIVHTISRGERADQLAVAISASGFTATGRVVLSDTAPLQTDILSREIAKPGKASAWLVTVPTRFIDPIVGAIRNSQAGVPLVVDGGLNDPAPILRQASAKDVVVLSSISPELVNQRPLARAIEARLRENINQPLTPSSALAATATQVLAQAVVAAKVEGEAYGAATRER
jgi:hypothetical protein